MSATEATTLYTEIGALIKEAKLHMNSDNEMLIHQLELFCIMTICAPPKVFVVCDFGSTWPAIFGKELALFVVAQFVAAVTIPSTFQLHVFGDDVELFFLRLCTVLADQFLSVMVSLMMELVCIEMLSSETSITVARACV